MIDPDRTLLVLNEIRAELQRLRGRMDFEFAEIRDRLQRLDERIDGFIGRVERLER
jgi:hypothetical protein